MSNNCNHCIFFLFNQCQTHSNKEACDDFELDDADWVPKFNTDF